MRAAQRGQNADTEVGNEAKSHQPSERDQIDVFRSVIFAGARDV